VKAAHPHFERARRGRYAVLVCHGRRVNHPEQPCPYHVIIANPGHPTEEEQASAEASKHWQDFHEGMTGDLLRQIVKGQLERSGQIAPSGSPRRGVVPPAA
jgi:hypothetical protein